MRHISFMAAGVAILVLMMVTTSAAQRPVLVGMKAQDVTPGSSGSSDASVSADGRFVAFQSSSRDLIVPSAIWTTNIYVRDLKTGTTSLVSVNRLGTDSGNAGSINPSISADG